MDFLKNAIEAEKSQKRKALEASQKGSAKKYFSRAELERQREEDYRREHEAYLEQERLVRTRFKLTFVDQYSLLITYYRRRKSKWKRRYVWL
jgi:hypothetical protein